MTFIRHVNSGKTSSHFTVTVAIRGGRGGGEKRFLCNRHRATENFVTPPMSWTEYYNHVQLIALDKMNGDNI